MPEIVGRREKPRLLVVGVGPESELAAHLSNFVPTIRIVPDASDMFSIRQGDWDAAVLWDVSVALDPHLFVVQFGRKVAGRLAGHVPYYLEFSGALSVGVELEIPDGLPGGIRQLVRDSLAPAAMVRQYKPIITAGRPGFSTRFDISELQVGSAFEPFLVDQDGKALAARFRRDGSSAEWWMLPEYAPHPERWVAAALDLWRAAHPNIFPQDAEWHRRPEWLTPAELGAEERVVAARRHLENEVEVLVDALGNAETARRETAERAEVEERRLMTAQGDDLKDAVGVALRALGFEVVDVDTEIATPGDLREDFRVTDPEVPGWVALTEVRGYSRGAQLGDLLRISGRFVPRYVQETGELPSRSWYIVNHFTAQDPSTRPQPLESNPQEVRIFADSNGLVIDTRSLFRLCVDAECGTQDREEARAALRSALGRWTSASSTGSEE